jgi:hypothetical protein
VNGVEQERLKQALDRLIEAEREALDVIAEGLEPDVGGLEEEEQLLVGRRLEAALEEVGAILEGAGRREGHLRGRRSHIVTSWLHTSQVRTRPRRDPRGLV